MAEIQSKVVRRQALQWDGSENSGYGIAAWVNSHQLDAEPSTAVEGPIAVFQPPTQAAGESLPSYLTLLTPNSGWVTASPGDWIIIDEKGHPYPCNPDVFESRWEIVDAEG